MAILAIHTNQTSPLLDHVVNLANLVHRRSTKRSLLRMYMAIFVYHRLIALDWMGWTVKL